MAIDFLTRRSRKLIHITRRPVCRPACRSARLPGFSSRSAHRASARSPSCRYVPGLVSSSHPVISSAHRSLSSSPSELIPHLRRRIGNGGWRATGTGAGGLFFLVRRFPQLIIIRLIIRFASSGRRPIVAVLTGRSRRCPLIISSGSLLTHPPLPSSHHGTRGGLGHPFFFKQATASHGIHPVMSSSSSSHHYLTVERLARRLVMKRLAWASRLDIPGASTGDGEDKDKQANTKEQG